MFTKEQRDILLKIQENVEMCSWSDCPNCPLGIDEESCILTEAGKQYGSTSWQKIAENLLLKDTEEHLKSLINIL